ncbi:MAG TPA: hypothetical protein VG900_13080 [Hyphomicrobiaceae bacterium]|nr:hypothetical protein [Hyphomicrobiaceae bacterium]
MRMIIVAGFLTAALLMAAISAVSVEPASWTWPSDYAAGSKTTSRLTPTPLYPVNPAAG